MGKGKKKRTEAGRSRVTLVLSHHARTKSGKGEEEVCTSSRLVVHSTLLPCVAGVAPNTINDITLYIT